MTRALLVLLAALLATPALAQQIGGGSGPYIALPATYFGASTNSPGTQTAVSTQVMSGLGSVNCTGPATGVSCLTVPAAITPTSTGRVHFEIVGNFAVATAATNVSLQICYGTGTAPVNVAAVTGTCLGHNLTQTKPVATGVGNSLAISADATGLTVGTTYWFDVAVTQAAAADAAGLNQFQVMAREF